MLWFLVLPTDGATNGQGDDDAAKHNKVKEIMV